MQINRSNANVGDSGANVVASAIISVLVTLGGVPFADLGAAICLLAGWTLTDGFNVRPGGCGVSVIEFINESTGIYDIRIVPFVGNGACA